MKNNRINRKKKENRLIKSAIKHGVVRSFKCNCNTNELEIKLNAEKQLKFIPNRIYKRLSNKYNFAFCGFHIGSESDDFLKQLITVVSKFQLIYKIK